MQAEGNLLAIECENARWGCWAACEIHVETCLQGSRDKVTLKLRTTATKIFTYDDFASNVSISGDRTINLAAEVLSRKRNRGTIRPRLEIRDGWKTYSKGAEAGVGKAWTATKKNEIANGGEGIQ